MKRSLTTLAILIAGCAAPPDPRLASIVERIDEGRLRAHVSNLLSEGPRGPTDRAALEHAMNYIRRELESYGYEVETEYTGFEYGDVSHSNLLATLKGSGTRPGDGALEEIVEIGAHYDTVPASPGADDNTSGVAGLLEICRVLADTRPEKTIRFCFFALEEMGLLGSGSHVGMIRRTPEESVEGILVLEMIGYTSSEPGSQDSPVRIPFVVWPPNTGDFILIVGNFPSGRLGNLFQEAAARYVPELRTYDVNRLGGFFPDAARSDHSRYWQAGMKGIMLTDTANFRNPHYHQPSDLPGSLDFQFMRRVSQAAAATMLEWAGWPAGSQHEAGEEKKTERSEPRKQAQP